MCEEASPPNQIDPYGVAHRLPGHRGASWTGNWDHGRARIICDMNPALRTGGRRSRRLFFLDEATALAAGFRPCFQCRYAYAKAFIARVDGVARTASLDRMIHAALGDLRLQTPDLPAGTFIDVDGSPCVVRPDGQVAEWTFGGYSAPLPMPDRYHVITPEPQLEALRNGYLVQIHESALTDRRH